MKKSKILKLVFSFVENLFTFFFSWSRSCSLFSLGQDIVFFLVFFKVKVVFLFSLSKACFLTYSLKVFFLNYRLRITRNRLPVVITFLFQISLNFLLHDPFVKFYRYWIFQIVEHKTEHFPSEYKV